MRSPFTLEYGRDGDWWVRRRHDMSRNPAHGKQAPFRDIGAVADTLCGIIRKQLGIGDEGDTGAGDA